MNPLRKQLVFTLMQSKMGNLQWKNAAIQSRVERLQWRNAALQNENEEMQNEMESKQRVCKNKCVNGKRKS